MRLFNDTVTSILLCDKPVICRVNGMRIGGGQEIEMACDFSIAGDHASFGQAEIADRLRATPATPQRAQPGWAPGSRAVQRALATLSARSR